MAPMRWPGHLAFHTMRQGCCALARRGALLLAAATLGALPAQAARAHAMAPVEDREIFTLCLGLAAVLLMVMFPRPHTMRGWAGRLPQLALMSLVVGWTATIAESYVLPAFLDLVEHTAYLASTCLLAAWVILLRRDAARASS